MPRFIIDHRVSQRQPFASLTGRCGPVMTGNETLH